jgi:hypothetical protein
MLFSKDNLQNLKPAKKAQSMVEYALLIGVTVGALLTMFHFYGRSVQGKLKESVDPLGGQFVANSRNDAVIMPVQPYAVGISENMHKSSSGFLFHTGLLPLGMAISVSTGSSTTTTASGIRQVPRVDVPEAQPVTNQDEIIRRMKNVAEQEYSKYPKPQEGGTEGETLE